jgi:catechol 2,3-dioxygenase-like lactoylglutathione lyase family enzyme
MSTRLDHVGLSVADLDACATFYSRAFGFEPEFPFELPGGIRGLMMLNADGVRVELFERPGSAEGIRAGHPIEALSTRGYGHFALTAVDIDPLFAAAVTAGAREIVAPSPSPEPGVRFAFLADPEGNLIELVQRSA